MSARPSTEIEKKEIQVTFGQVFSGVSSPCNHEGYRVVALGKSPFTGDAWKTGVMNWETMKVKYLPEPPKV